MNKETPISTASLKIVSIFLLILSAGLAIWASITYVRMNTYRSALQNTWLRAADLASDNLANLSSDLVKGMYAGTSPQLSMISSKMWKESAAAKSALCTLPVTDTTLENTNKFLSQAGDYAIYLSQKSANGEPITDEERQNFASLREYADRLSAQMDQIATALSDGSLTIEQLNAAEQQADADTDAVPAAVESTSQLKQVEDSFTGYPTLIYDGPFSDHLLERTPRMTEGQPELTVDQARQKLSTVTTVDLPEMREENSTLPSYVFHDGANNSVAITKNGGYLCYLVTDKSGLTGGDLSYDEAVQKAQTYLEKNGYTSMKDTYYETSDGVMTLNFAYYHPDTQTICYTDLIKVEVSLSDGAIVGLDARGYLVNHTDRTFEAPALTVEQARQSVSSVLTVESTRLALIPTSGQNEVLTYEFLCSSSTGDKVLCYVDTQTGAEEQLLILLQTPNGMLTK